MYRYYMNHLKRNRMQRDMSHRVSPKGVDKETRNCCTIIFCNQLNACSLLQPRYFVCLLCYNKVNKVETSKIILV